MSWKSYHLVWCCRTLVNLVRNESKIILSHINMLQQFSQNLFFFSQFYSKFFFHIFMFLTYWDRELPIEWKRAKITYSIFFVLKLIRLSHPSHRQTDRPYSQVVPFWLTKKLAKRLTYDGVLNLVCRIYITQWSSVITNSDITNTRF